jgi:hypothetical protein
MMPLVDGITVVISKSPPGDDVNFTWALQGKLRTYNFHFYLDQYPTFNCQMSSIGHMDYILSGTENRAQALGALSEGYRLAGLKPKIILIDIDNAYMDKMDSYFANHILMKNPYESTSGSKMCLYMVYMPSA